MSTETGQAVGELLVDAIRERRRVRFIYGGYRRTVEPYLVGIHVAGEAILRGYQTEGGSASGSVPGWRTFILAEIGDLQLLPGQFESAPLGYSDAPEGWLEIFARVHRP